MDFLDYYRENLGYLRALGAEFAAEFPKVAARLDLSSFECQDPYVERLLEGTAFLSARVEKKLDDGYKRLLESVLGSVAPDALYPVASGAVLEMSPDASSDLFSKGKYIPVGSNFDAFVPSINTPCRFSSLWSVPLAPFRLEQAEYVTRDLSRFQIERPHMAALHIRLSLPAGRLFSSISVPELAFFLNLPDTLSSLLLRQLTLDVEDVYLSTNGETYVSSGAKSFSVSATEEVGGFFAGQKGNLNGIRVLQSFLTYPAFFKFVTMKDTGNLLNRETSEIDLLIAFNRRESELGNEIKTSSLKLNCVPALNLFKKRSDRIFLDKEAYEFHIVPERTAMRDFEVYAVRRLEFYNEKNETLFCASNFYDEDLAGQNNDKRNFFSVHRRLTLFDQKVRQRSSYTGSEVFVSISEREALLQDATQFNADLICSNRDMPLLLTADTRLSCADAAVQSVSFVVLPTRPDYPLISKGNTSDWAKVSHIIFNLSSMFWQDGTLPLEMLKMLLRNYNFRSDEEMERILDGIVELKSEPATFRFIKNGAVFFETGWKVQFVLDEQAYAGIGFYTFAVVLKEIFHSFTPLNSLIEVQCFTQQSEYVATWKMSGN